MERYISYVVGGRFGSLVVRRRRRRRGLKLGFLINDRDGFFRSHYEQNVTMIDGCNLEGG